MDGERLKLSDGEAAAVRDAIAAKLARRGASLRAIGLVVGASPTTVHRRLRSMTPDVRREREAADLGGVL
ncbi:MAG: hypothetical protein BGO49_21470 [Planctomycetales bacterium 71-10]|nr:MAG: hypothetical protein BGO49_21470 [Planctomycetales bacterium 71-10]